MVVERGGKVRWMWQGRLRWKWMEMGRGCALGWAVAVEEVAVQLERELELE